MNEPDIDTLFSWLDQVECECLSLDESGGPANYPVPVGTFDELTLFFRGNNICWAEVGNESPYFQRLLSPFEEAQFYSVPKFYWNTQVPWKNTVWDGGIILVVPEGSGDLRARALKQFKKYQVIQERPLFKKTEEIFGKLLAQGSVDPLVQEEFDLVCSIYDGDLVMQGDVRNLYWSREIARQYLLMKKTTLGDVVFVTDKYKKTTGVSKMKEQPCNTGVTFFKLGSES